VLQADCVWIEVKRDFHTELEARFMFFHFAGSRTEEQTAEGKKGFPGELIIRNVSTSLSLSLFWLKIIYEKQ
jgi:hypothetical protein